MASTLSAQKSVARCCGSALKVSASKRVLKQRTPTNLYNLWPTWLDLAHKRLDEAVLDAYGWPHELPDEEILERLLALNLERAGASAIAIRARLNRSATLAASLCPATARPGQHRRPFLAEGH